VVDFDPGGGGDYHTSNGQFDAYLSQFLRQAPAIATATPTATPQPGHYWLHLPLMVR
jgi:hypothetical protein